MSIADSNTYVQYRAKRVEIVMILEKITRSGCTDKDINDSIDRIFEILEDVVENKYVLVLNSGFAYKYISLMWPILQKKQNSRTKVLKLLDTVAENLFSCFNPNSILSSIQNTKDLINIIIGNDIEQRDYAIKLLAIILQYTKDNNLSYEQFENILPINNPEDFTRIPPCIIYYIFARMEGTKNMDKRLVDAVSKFMLHYSAIDLKPKGIMDQEIERNIPYTYKYFALIMKRDDDDSNKLSFLNKLRELLDSENSRYVEAGLDLAKALELPISIIEGIIHKFFDNDRNEHLSKAILAIIQNENNWQNNDDICSLILEKIPNILRTTNIETKKKILSLITVADPITHSCDPDIISDLFECVQYDYSILPNLKTIADAVMSRIIKNNYDENDLAVDLEDKYETLIDISNKDIDKTYIDCANYLINLYNENLDQRFD